MISENEGLLTRGGQTHLEHRGHSSRLREASFKEVLIWVEQDQ